MSKRSLRLQLLAKRRALTDDLCLESARQAESNLLSLEEYSLAGSVALYAPTDREIGTSTIFAAALDSGKRILYPALCKEVIVFRLVERHSILKKGTFGILEPLETGSDYQADEADLIVVPGVVFDAAGHRIGYGKGYYDKFLCHKGLKTTLVGFCHDFQLIDALIPADRHDIKMDIIVTSRRIIYCRK